ncbi:hypothetical protein J41TS2_19510 [Bacillus sonorensis]|nr:hypothetical protein J41TS2_19510 [Bacillus sonorensis]
MIDFAIKMINNVEKMGVIILPSRSTNFVVFHERIMVKKINTKEKINK